MKKFFLFLTLLTLSIGQMWGATATWALVESTPTDWSGEYLIVYNANCFNGHLTSGFNGNAGQSVSISNKKITKDDQYAMIVGNKSGSTYSLKTASGYYIGRQSSSSNGVDASTTYNSTNLAVSFGSWNATNKTVKISGVGGKCLGNNSGSWKFFASSNQYVNVSLYKKVTLSSIAVKTAPTKIDYTEGENFAPAGLVITLTYSDSSTEDVTYNGTTASSFTFSPTTSTSLTTSHTSVSITYGGKSTSQAITVAASGCTNNINIIKGSESHGTFTLDKDGSQATCSGLSVVVTPSAADHYHVGSVSATTGETGSDNGDGTWTITYAADVTGSSTINVVFAEDPAATISFENAGTPAPTTTGYYVDDSYTLPSSNNYSCSGGKTFIGWSTVPVASQDTKPSSNFHEPGASVTLGASQTFYAVFANATPGEAVKYDPFSATLGGSNGNTITSGYTLTTQAESKAGFYQDGSGTLRYVQVASTTAMFTSTPSSITVTAKIGGGTSNTDLANPVYAQLVDANGDPIGTAAIITEHITTNTGDTYSNISIPTTGITSAYGLRIYHTKESGYNVRYYSMSLSYTVDGTTYSAYSTDCCSPLASINGSVSVTNDGCGAGELKATWKTSSTGLDGIASQTVKVYRADNNNEVTGLTGLTGKTAQTTDQTVTISGLTPCVEYYVKIWNVSKDGSYCESDFAGDKSSNVAAASYTITKTGVMNVTAESLSAIPATTCASGFNATIVAASGYDLPGTITVTGANHTWSQATGALTISNVTGNVVITITPTEAQCTPLTAPSVSVSGKDYPYDAVTLSWTAVEHADGYTVEIYDGETKIEGDDLDGGADSYTIGTTLAANKTYTYKVKATSETPATYCPSEWATDDFTTSVYPTVKLFYSENGELSAGVDQKILTDFTLPNEAAECSKTFIGWTTAANASYSHASTAPDPLYAPGKTDFQIPTNANCTLYAVYADVIEASTNWTRVTAVNTLTAGGTFIMGYEATSNNGVIVPMQNSVSSNFAYSGDGTNASNSNTIDMGNVNFSTAKYEISVVASTVVNGAINIKFGDKFLGNENEKNCAKLYTEEAATTAFTPTIGENDVFTLEIKANTGKTDNYKFLKFNTDPNYPRFAVYKTTPEKIVFYKKNVTEASVTNYVTICQGKVAKPVISGVAEGTTYEEAKTITITSATTGATIYYTTDGTEPTTSSNAYSTPFEVSANGDYTIRAIAVKDEMVNSDEATAVSFSLDLPFTTIASFIAATPTNKKLVFTAESNARVLAYNKNRIYIQDGTGAMFLYNTGSNNEGHGKTWASGKKIVGTLTGTYSLTNNMPRMTVTDFGATDVTADAIELPTPIAVEALATNFASNVCKLVTINDVSIRSESVADNYTINMTKSNVTYNIYNAFNALTGHKLPLGTTSCTVTGILGQSNGTTLQLMPISADGISTNGAEAVLPVVSVTGSTNSAEPFEVATNKEITFTPNSNFDAVYAINDGEEAAVTGSSNVTITDEADATKVTIRATREYYTTKEVSYYYRANSALIEYDITKGAMSHGSATIQNAQGDAITYAVGGATVTLIANPAEHYHWVSWNVTAGGEPVTVTNNTFEMPNAAVTVSATFEEDDYATVAFAKGNASVTGDAPASQKVYVGENATMPGKGSMILSSHNFAGWKLGSNAVLNTGDTYTVTAEDHEAGTITFEAQWEPYPWGGNGKWELVTDEEDLNAGDYVVIACNSQSTIAGDISNNIMASVDGTFSGDKNSITSIGDACVLTLGKSDDNWTFTNVDAELLGATAAKNLAWGSSGTTTWSISIADAEGEYKATIQNTTSTYGRFLYNSGQPRFTTYTSSTSVSMILPQLYKFVGGSYYNIVYAKGTEDEVRNMPEGHVTDENGEAAIKENTPIRVGYTFTGWKDQDENVYTYNDGQIYAFTKNVTLTAQWEEQTDKYTVSYDANGSSDAVPAEAAYFENAEVTVAGAVSKEGFVFMGWECNGRVYTAGSRFYMPAADMPMVAKYAHGATYDNMTKVNNVCSIESHDAPEGSEAVFTNNYTTAKQITKNNSMTLTLSGYTGYTIEGVKLSTGSNNTSGQGTLSITIGGVEVATDANADKWYNGVHHYGSNNGTDFENVLVSMNPKTVKYGEDIVITIAASESSLFCQSFTILYDLLPVEVEDAATIEARDLANGTEVTIHDGGTLNVNANKSLDNLIIEAGGEVSGASALTVNNLTINSEAGKSGQVMNENVTVNGDIYLEIKLDKSGTMDPHKYYCISAPFDVAALEWGNGTPMVFNVDYQLFIYDGDKRARTGNGWQRVGGTIEKNSAYFIGFDDENTNNQNIIRLKAANKAIPTATSIELEEHPATYGQDESEIAKNSNWNGLGNPRLNYVNLNKNVSVYEAEEERFDTYAEELANGFVVGTAFFVQGTGNLTFENEAHGAYRAPKRESEHYMYCVEIAQENASRYDNRLYVMASETASTSFEEGKDLPTLNSETSKYGALIWTKNYGMRLVIEETPMVNNKASYELGIFAPANGTYRIETPTVREDADLYLTYEGAIIWDLSMGAYEAELAKGQNEGYGLLLVKKMPMTPTGVDEVQSDKVQCTKVVIDEHVYILRGGEMYDVTGKAVK